MAGLHRFYCIVLTNIGHELFRTVPENKTKNNIVKKYLKNRFPEFDIKVNEVYTIIIENTVHAKPTY